jgi:predicted nucleic-acid-binding protein
MIGLDTNVLVRYLVKDDPRQAAKAAAYIRDAIERNETLFLNHIVLCELVWVFELAYRYPKHTVLDVLEKVLLTKQFLIERKDEVWAALGEFREDHGDFADYLIGRANHSRGCEHTVTFDQTLKGSQTFRIL